MKHLERIYTDIWKTANILATLTANHLHLKNKLFRDRRRQQAYRGFLSTLRWAQCSSPGYFRKILDLCDKSGQLSESLGGCRENQSGESWFGSMQTLLNLWLPLAESNDDYKDNAARWDVLEGNESDVVLQVSSARGYRSWGIYRKHPRGLLSQNKISLFYFSVFWGETMKPILISFSSSSSMTDVCGSRRAEQATFWPWLSFMMHIKHLENDSQKERGHSEVKWRRGHEIGVHMPQFSD